MRAQQGQPTIQELLFEIYRSLEARLGDRQWWPAETREEMMIGALLVQNVSWANTVRALDKLRQMDLLTFPALCNAPSEAIEECIRSTRFYKSKTQKLKALAQHVVAKYDNNLDTFFHQPMEQLRGELLRIHGIGQETADDILLYAAQFPSFVIDAYTKRIFARLGLIDETIPYQDLRAWFMNHLPADVRLYNQYHALLDAIGHSFCTTKKPKCMDCPLNVHCQFALNTVIQISGDRAPGCG